MVGFFQGLNRCVLLPTLGTSRTCRHFDWSVLGVACRWWTSGIDPARFLSRTMKFLRRWTARGVGPNLWRSQECDARSLPLNRGSGTSPSEACFPEKAYFVARTSALEFCGFKFSGRHRLDGFMVIGSTGSLVRHEVVKHAKQRTGMSSRIFMWVVRVWKTVSTFRTGTPANSSSDHFRGPAFGKGVV